METIHINLIGGNGVGKTAIAAEVYLTLQAAGYSCALIPDETKRLALSGQLASTNPFLIFSDQLRHQIQLNGKVDVTICDSSPLIPIMDMPAVSHVEMVHVLKHITRDWIFLNIFVDREHSYEGIIEGWGTCDQANWRHRRLKEFVQRHFDNLKVMPTKQVTSEIVNAIHQFGLLGLEPRQKSILAAPVSEKNPSTLALLEPGDDSVAATDNDIATISDGGIRWSSVMAGKILNI